jgi:hypothetical protein
VVVASDGSNVGNASDAIYSLSDNIAFACSWDEAACSQLVQCGGVPVLLEALGVLSGSARGPLPALDGLCYLAEAGTLRSVLVDAGAIRLLLDYMCHGVAGLSSVHASALCCMGSLLAPPRLAESALHDHVMPVVERILCVSFDALELVHRHFHHTSTTDLDVATHDDVANDVLRKSGFIFGGLTIQIEARPYLIAFGRALVAGYAKKIHTLVSAITDCTRLDNIGQTAGFLSAALSYIVRLADVAEVDRARVCHETIQVRAVPTLLAALRKYSGLGSAASELGLLVLIRSTCNTFLDLSNGVCDCCREQFRAEISAGGTSVRLFRRLLRRRRSEDSVRDTLTESESMLLSQILDLLKAP